MKDRRTLLRYIQRRDKLNNLLIKNTKINEEINKLNMAIQLLMKTLKKENILCNCCSTCLDENISPLNK